MDIQSIDPSLGGLTAVNGVTPTTMTSPPPTPHLDGTLDGIAQQLSMTPDALRAELGQGASITDLAQQKGVSRDDLVKSVEDQIQQQRAANGAQPLDQSQLDRMVNRAFDRHRGGHHHHNAASASTTAPATAQAHDSDATNGGVDVRV